ncbi:MAG: siderophore-interacting protein [Pseudomonadota bacterium]
MSDRWRTISGSVLKMIKQTTGKNRMSPRVLVVDTVKYITPNMIRITFAGPALEGIAMDCAGANCKLLLPEDGQTLEAFKEQMISGPKPVTRTYTVRSMRSDPLEMDIDFVAHGENGPASKWAMNAKPGSFCGFAGPGKAKLTEFYADWYLIAADMSALPVACATLEAMPRDAEGIAIFEVLSVEDKQSIKAPNGIEIHWLVSPDPLVHSKKQLDFVQNLDWPPGVVQTCVAGESGVIRELRNFLNNDMMIERKHTYISGYWKIGLVEDEHQVYKRSDA